MDTVCAIPGAALAVDRSHVPDPAIDIKPGEGTVESTAVLAGGCFWCTEAVFSALDGVLEVTSGYSGGSESTAGYDAVCSGTTDHAEAIRIRFDPRRISYGQLLKVFFAVAHDPTQINRQGNDSGRQYRSAVFYAGDAQREVAEAYIRQLNDAKVFTAPIATEVVALDAFYDAERYHQNYAALHPEQSYIAYVAAPKVEKLKKEFGARLKPDA
jgi:peptide-methionine (S)-S-oxide reductase